MEKKNISLSKSSYVSGLQCPKMLWMRRYMPEELDKSVINASVMTKGNEVGDFAMKCFGSYVEVPINTDGSDKIDKKYMADYTKKLLKKDTEIIAEASFSYRGLLFCSVDILKKNNDSYEIIEVKSSTAEGGDENDGADKIDDVDEKSAPAEVLTTVVDIEKKKKQYLNDLAFQYYVLTKCKIKVSKAELMLLNKKYIRDETLDLEKLFIRVDCTKKIINMQSEIEENIQNIKKYWNDKNEPVYSIGARCEKPYECAFKGWCYNGLPKNNVFELGFGMWDSTKESLYQSGIISYESVLKRGVKLSLNQRQQVEAALTGVQPEPNKEEIKSFLAGIKPPIYHLDFETFMEAIPQYRETSPYKVIPFQYSIHIQNEKGEEIPEHKSGDHPGHKPYLTPEELEPKPEGEPGYDVDLAGRLCRSLAEQLCKDIGAEGTVLAYNASYEMTVIKRLAEMFDDLRPQLESINDRMVDLEVPFAGGHYYHSDMGGSSSIKKVLPAILGYDPYENLTVISQGDNAMNMFPTLYKMPKDEKKETREALLEYCKTDTWAMVQLLNKLHELANGSLTATANP